MADLDLLPLRCPSCGARSPRPAPAAGLGAELRCGHCGVTTVLAVELARVPGGGAPVPATGRACPICSDPVGPTARFCQQGHPLERTCLACGEAFPSHHERCDFCGRIQLEVQVEQAEARLQDLAREKVPDARVPVPGLGAPALEVRIRTLEAQAAQVVPLRRLAKVLLLLATAVLASKEAWPALLLVPVLWKVASTVARRRLRHLDGVLSLHRQALAVVGRNARLDHEIAGVRAELLKLRDAAPA